eukprot:6210435-Pleurochrysis_carterae.AAC.2
MRHPVSAVAAPFVVSAACIGTPRSLLRTPAPGAAPSLPATPILLTSRLSAHSPRRARMHSTCAPNLSQPVLRTSLG